MPAPHTHRTLHEYMSCIPQPPPHRPRHLHALDLRFHLDRQTGAVTRVLDRGARSINFVLSSLVFNVVPTALEIALVSAILAHTCGVEYAGVLRRPGREMGVIAREYLAPFRRRFPQRRPISLDRFPCRQSVTTLATMASYVWFTVSITTWRTGIRKDVNRCGIEGRTSLERS